MAEHELISAGYENLVHRLSLQVVPHYRASYVALKGAPRRVEKSPEGYERHVYPKQYMPEDSLIGQLEFGLKYDGVNLEILGQVFQAVGPKPIEAGVNQRPTGKYTRSLWYLYEWLTGQTLNLPDLKVGNYVDLLDPEAYFTVEQPVKSTRHRVNDNMLGTPAFCPTVRRTETLTDFVTKDLSRAARQVVQAFDADALARASRYLYLKETKSSYEIERERPDQARTHRFVQLLSHAGRMQSIDKAALLELQNAIIDERFADADYRHSQNYVGEALSYTRQRVHFVSPRPEDVPSMMDGLLEQMRRMHERGAEPVIQAASASFGFVFIHPFEDGNGRIHRFLIHQILSREGFTPEGIIFPVSAAMLANMREYDRCLEQFSEVVAPLADYTLYDDGSMAVHNETAYHYRYFDATAMAEYLYGVVEKTIHEDLAEELDFIVKYREAKMQMQAVVDMPDRKIDQFLRFSLQNQGQLAKSKRKRHFGMLRDEEVHQLETVVQETFLSGDPEPGDEEGPDPEI